MLPLRTLKVAGVRTNVPAIFAVQLRYQSTAAASVGSVIQEKTPSKDKSDKNGPKKQRPQVPRKVREISRQVKLSIESAKPSELSEVIDMVEEGTSYLREIQHEDRIKDRELYLAFQPILAKLFDKLFAADASFGSRSLVDVLNMLCDQRMAHRYHFTRVAQHMLSQAQQKPEMYNEVLLLWLKFAEYHSSLDTSRAIVFNNYNSYKDRGYTHVQFKAMVYFAYVMLAVNAGASARAEDVLKIIAAVDKNAFLPDSFVVERTLSELALKEALGRDVSRFNEAHRNLKTESLDPNGNHVLNRLDKLMENLDARALDRFYPEICNASVRNKKPLHELTLNKIMMAFLAVKSFDRVLDVFRDMVAGGYKKPSNYTFDLVFKAIGHPDRLQPMTAKEREDTVTAVDATLAAMKTAGVTMTPRTLAYVVACYANIGNFDKVEKVMKEYSNLATIDATKNNILVGLIMNNRISDAEDKLQEYLAADKSFTPYTFTMNSFLAHYTKNSQFNAVEGILNFMRSRKIPEDVATITTAIDFYFKQIVAKGRVPDLDTVLAHLNERDDIDWTPSTINTILDSLTKTGLNIEAARAVNNHFAAISPKYRLSPGMNTTMIRAELDYGSFFNAEELFDFYIKNIRNDTRIWNMMIRGCLLQDTDTGIAYYKKLVSQQALGAKPNYFTYYFLLLHFERKGLNDKIQWALDELSGANLEEFGDVLPAILNRLKKQNFHVNPALSMRMSHFSR